MPGIGEMVPSSLSQKLQASWYCILPFRLWNHPHFGGCCLYYNGFLEVLISGRLTFLYFGLQCACFWALIAGGIPFVCNMASLLIELTIR